MSANEVKSLQMKIKSDPAELGRVRQEVEQYAGLCGMDEEATCSVVLAIDEALTNVIRHAYGNAVDQPIEIDMAVSDGRLRIVVCDYGKTVDKTKIKSRDLDDIRPGGLGVHIIKKCMDCVDFQPRPGEGNVLIMEKKLRLRRSKRGITMSEPVKNVRWKDKTAIVDISGDIDLHRSNALQMELMKVLDEKPGKILVNLSDVPYMDSSGVASLVKLLSRTRKVGVELVLVAPSPKVKSILEITRLDSVFNVCENENEA